MEDPMEADGDGEGGDRAGAATLGHLFPPNQQGGSSHSVLGFFELQHMYARMWAPLFGKHQSPMTSQKAEGQSSIAFHIFVGNGWFTRCLTAAPTKSASPPLPDLAAQLAATTLTEFGALRIPMETDCPEASRSNMSLAPGNNPPMALKALVAMASFSLNRSLSAAKTTKPSSAPVTASPRLSSKLAPESTILASMEAALPTDAASADIGSAVSPSRIMLCTVKLSPATDKAAS
mmetsp:Transcript_103280/g.258939  ORF Transcript_103280/g.258939 Transcript_103280/m.258939 type:complete len:234 (-) Transcript_103280:3910-4611(-)